MQEKHNSSANALQLYLSCTNPSIYSWSQSVKVGTHIGPMHLIICKEKNVQSCTILFQDGLPIQAFVADCGGQVVGVAILRKEEVRYGFS